MPLAKRPFRPSQQMSVKRLPATTQSDLDPITSAEEYVPTHHVGGAMLPTTEQKEQTTMEESAQVDLQQHNKECCGKESSNSINESFVNNDDQDDESFVIREVENVEPITPCSRESDELQKVLLEAVVAHTQNDAETHIQNYFCQQQSMFSFLNKLIFINLTNYLKPFQTHYYHDKN